MDAISVFGFMSGFVACVLVGYRRQLKTRFPVIAVSLGCCAAYGFMAGLWPLGFLLTVLAATEFGGRQQGASRTVTVPIFRTAPARNVIRVESRMSRMFGST